jgi:hypothetical protein
MAVPYRSHFRRKERFIEALESVQGAAVLEVATVGLLSQVPLGECFGTLVTKPLIREAVFVCRMREQERIELPQGLGYRISSSEPLETWAQGSLGPALGLPVAAVTEPLPPEGAGAQAPEILPRVDIGFPPVEGAAAEEVLTGGISVDMEVTMVAVVVVAVVPLCEDIRVDILVS